MPIQMLSRVIREETRLLIAKGSEKPLSDAEVD